MWSGRLTEVQTTTRPDHVWPEVWTKIGKAAESRENTKGKTKSHNSKSIYLRIEGVSQDAILQDEANMNEIKEKLEKLVMG